MPSHEVVFTFKVFLEGKEVDFVLRRMSVFFVNSEICEGCCVALKHVNSALQKLGGGV